MSSMQITSGRVDESGNVYLLDNGVERLIGSQPLMSVDEAVSFYQKRFEDLQANVRLLEQRLKANADAKSVLSSAKKIATELVSPNVLGDVQSLRDRVKAIEDSLSEQVEKLDQERQKAVEESLASLEKLVASVEGIISKDPSKVNYKQASAKLAEVMQQWQAAQKSTVRIPKGKADALWKRLSAARKTFESNKRNFFATQEKVAKASKQARNDIVAKAEALVAKGAEATAEYKELLNAWKNLPKSKSKGDEDLWARFKAAGDAIYAAKAEKNSKDEIEFAANLEVKLALLVEAEAIDPEKNLDQAKSTMKSIQARWEKAGKVPRDSIRKTEDRLRAVEAKIKSVEQELWRKSDPATIDRTNSMKSQLEGAIAKLEQELGKANADGNSKLVEELEKELETKRSWLAVIG